MATVFNSLPPVVALADQYMPVVVNGTGANIDDVFYELGVKIVDADGNIQYIYKTPTTLNSTTKQTNITVRNFFLEDKTGHFTLPHTKDIIAVKHSIIDELKIYTTERYGLDSTEIVNTHYESVLLLPGGISEARQAALNKRSVTFFDDLLSRKAFLSFAPLVKKTDIYAPEKLYWFFQSAQVCNLRVHKTYKCGAQATATLAVVNAAQFDLYEFCVSYKNIKQEDPFKIYKYEIYLANATNSEVLSEVRTFIVDRTYQQYARYFLVKNKLGVYELFRSTGKAGGEVDYERESSENILPQNFVPTSRKIRPTKIESTDSYTINSGNIDDVFWYMWLRELMESKDLYLLRNNEAYPIYNTTKKLPFKKDGEFIFNTEITFNGILTDDISADINSSNPVLPGDYSPDFNADFTNLGEDGEPEIDISDFAYAGGDQNITGLTGTLNAGNDSGSWSMISGPGTIIFSAPNNKTTNILATESGTYVIRWSVASSCDIYDDIVVIFTVPDALPAAVFEDFTNIESVSNGTTHESAITLADDGQFETVTQYDHPTFDVKCAGTDNEESNVWPDGTKEYYSNVNNCVKILDGNLILEPSHLLGTESIPVWKGTQPDILIKGYLYDGATPVNCKVEINISVLDLMSAAYIRIYYRETTGGTLKYTQVTAAGLVTLETCVWFAVRMQTGKMTISSIAITPNA